MVTERVPRACLSTEEEESDVEIRQTLATIRNEVLAGCSCACLRDVGLASGFRAHPPNTANKIDQILPKIVGKMGEDEKSICIWGGAATYGSRYAKMATSMVRDTFEKVWSIDPKFARGVDNCVKAKFQDTQPGGTNIFFSDIWDDTAALGNNHLSDVVSWFRRCIPSARWHKLLLVHKLTWSTTNTVEMAKVIAEFKTF